MSTLLTPDFSSDDPQQQSTQDEPRTTPPTPDEFKLKDRYDSPDEWLTDYSRRHRVPEHLVRSLVEDSPAISDEVAKRYKVDPRNPYDAITGVVNHLADSYAALRPHSKTDAHAYQLAVAAYHAGIDPVLNRLKAGEDYPDFKAADGSSTNELTWRVWEKYLKLKGGEEASHSATSDHQPQQQEQPQQQPQPTFTQDQIDAATKAAAEKYGSDNKSFARNPNISGNVVYDDENPLDQVTIKSSDDRAKVYVPQSPDLTPHELDAQHSQDALNDFYRQYRHIYSTGDLNAAKQFADTTPVGRHTYAPVEDPIQEDRQREAALRSLASHFTSDQAAIDRLITDTRLKGGGQIRFHDPQSGEELHPIPGQPFNVSLKGTQALELANAERARQATEQSKAQAALDEFDTNVTQGAMRLTPYGQLLSAAGVEPPKVPGVGAFLTGLTGTMRDSLFGSVTFYVAGKPVEWFDERLGRDIRTLGYTPRPTGSGDESSAQAFGFGSRPEDYGFSRTMPGYRQLEQKLGDLHAWGGAAGLVVNAVPETMLASRLSVPLSKLLSPAVRRVAPLVSGESGLGIGVTREVAEANALRAAEGAATTTRITGQLSSALAFSGIELAHPEAARFDINKLNQTVDITRAIPEIKDGKVALRAEGLADLAKRYGQDALMLSAVSALTPVVSQPLGVAINNDRLKAFIEPYVAGALRANGQSLTGEQVAQRLNQYLSNPALLHHVSNGIVNTFQSALMSDRVSGQDLFRDFLVGVGQSVASGSHRAPDQFIRTEDGKTYAAYYSDAKGVAFKPVEKVPEGVRVVDLPDDNSLKLFSAGLVANFGTAGQLDRLNRTRFRLNAEGNVETQEKPQDDYSLRDRLKLGYEEYKAHKTFAEDLVTGDDTPRAVVKGNSVELNPAALRELEPIAGLKLGATTLDGATLRAVADRVQNPELRDALKSVPDGSVNVTSTGVRNVGLNRLHEGVHTKLTELINPRQASIIARSPEFDALRREVGGYRNYDDYELVHEALAYGVTGDPQTLAPGVRPETVSAAARRALEELPPEVGDSLRANALSFGRDILSNKQSQGRSGLTELNLSNRASVVEANPALPASVPVTQAASPPQNQAPPGSQRPLIQIDDRAYQLTRKAKFQDGKLFYAAQDSEGNVRYLTEDQIRQAPRLNDAAKRLLFRDETPAPPQTNEGWLRLAEKFKKAPLTDEERQTITAAYLTDPGTENMVKALEPYKASVADFLTKVYRAGLLSGVGTSFANVKSNTLMQVLEEAHRSLAAPIDIAVSLSTGTPRQVQGVSLKGVAHGLKHLGEGWDEFVKDVKYGEADNPYSNPGRIGIAALDNTVGKVADYVVRFVSGQDKVFKAYAYHRAMYEQAWLEQKAGGRSIEDVLDNPTPEQADRALRFATYSTFTGKNETVAAFNKWKNSNVVKKLFLDYQLPFARTGMNVFGAAMDYLSINGIYKAVKGYGEYKGRVREVIGQPENRRAIELAVSRGMTGTALVIVGYQLAKAGLMTSFYDRKDKDELDEQNAEPLSVKIGDRWFGIERLSPVGTLIGVGAAMYRDEEKDVAGSILRNVAETAPLLKFASDLPKKSSAELFVPDANRFIPNIARETAKLSDVKRQVAARDPKTGKVDAWQTYLNRLKASLPGWRKTLPPVTTALGQQVAEKEPLMDSKAARTNALIDEMSRLRWAPAIRQDDPVEMRLAVKDALEQAVGSAEYRGLEDKERVTFLSQIAEEARREWKDGQGDGGQEDAGKERKRRARSLAQDIYDRLKERQQQSSGTR